MIEARAVRELLQTQVPRIDANETMAQSTTVSANQMQPAIADIINRLTSIEATLGIEKHGRNGESETCTKMSRIQNQ